MPRKVPAGAGVGVAQGQPPRAYIGREGGHRDGTVPAMLRPRAGKVKRMNHRPRGALDKLRGEGVPVRLLAAEASEEEPAVGDGVGHRAPASRRASAWAMRAASSAGVPHDADDGGAEALPGVGGHLGVAGVEGRRTRGEAQGGDKLCEVGLFFEQGVGDTHPPLGLAGLGGVGAVRDGELKGLGGGQVAHAAFGCAVAPLPARVAPHEQALHGGELLRRVHRRGG
jgi:hypothetical protein